MHRSSNITTFLDPSRFDRLPEAEILQRIGALLAAAIIRNGRLQPRPVQQSREDSAAPAARFDPLRLLTDPLERQIADYLRLVGAASPAELRRALGVRPRSLTRALARVRRGGLCEVVGHTRATRYRLRRDFTQN